MSCPKSEVGPSCARLRLPVAPPGENEKQLRRGIGRSVHIDDMQRISGYRSLLASRTAPNAADLSSIDLRLARMLVANISDQVLTKEASLQSALDLVWTHPQVKSELVELLDVLEAQIDHVHSRGTEFPLPDP